MPATAFRYLAGVTGASVDESEMTVCFAPVIANADPSCLVKLLASFLLSYPLAGLLKRVPDAKPYQKNLFTIRYVVVSDPR